MNEFIYGIHVVKFLFKKNPKRFLDVYVIKNSSDKRLSALMEEFNLAGIVIHECTRKWLDNKVQGAVHQGIVAKLNRKRHNLQFNERNLSNFLDRCFNPFLLILDGITDPHNLGACLRCADAAGVNLVISSRRKSIQINATVIKVSSGASETVPFISVTNLSRTLNFLKKKDIWIVGLDINANNIIFNTKVINRVAVVMGSEGFGMRRLTKQFCDELVSIPMMGSLPCLNVSVAAGICLFDIVRKRMYSSVF